MVTNWETIEVDRGDDGVMTVTLNRPEALNAFNDQMCSEFSALWASVREDPGVRAIVLRAAGDRAFSVGVDVKERLSKQDRFVDEIAPWKETTDPGRALSPKRNEVWVPIIAAVNGMCAGGAAYWIAECDIVVCEPQATFFDPHVTYGMVAALEPIALAARMQFSSVIRMALLGSHERMTADTALRSGLVTEIVERDSLRDRAHAIAAAIASQPAVAVQGTVKAIWQSLDMARGQALSSALMYTQIGNPLAADRIDRAAAKPNSYWLR